MIDKYTDPLDRYMFLKVMSKRDPSYLELLERVADDLASEIIKTRKREIEISKRVIQQLKNDLDFHEGLKP